MVLGTEKALMMMMMLMLMMLMMMARTALSTLFLTSHACPTSDKHILSRAGEWMCAGYGMGSELYRVADGIPADTHEGKSAVPVVDPACSRCCHAWDVAVDKGQVALPPLTRSQSGVKYMQYLNQYISANTPQWRTRQKLPYGSEELSRLEQVRCRGPQGRLLAHCHSHLVGTVR